MSDFDSRVNAVSVKDPDWVEKLLRIVEGEEDFTEMSLPQQVEARINMFRWKAETDPDWVTLPEEIKRKKLGEIVARTPSFESEDFQQKADAWTETLASKNWKDRAIFNAFFNTSIRNAVKTSAIARGSQALARNLWSRMKYPWTEQLPEGHALRGVESAWTEGDELLYDQGMRDWEKLIQYQKLRLDETKALGMLHTAVGGVATLATDIAETATLYNTIGAGFSFRAPKGVFGPVITALKQMGKPGTASRMVAEGAAFLTQAAIGGVVGDIREGFLDAISENGDNVDMQKFFVNAKENFVRYALWDVVGNFFFDVFGPFMRSFGGAVIGKHGMGRVLKKAYKHLTDGQFKELQTNWLTMKDVPEGTMQILNDADPRLAQQLSKFWTQTQNLGKVGLRTEAELFQLRANHHRYVADFNKDKGLWELTRFGDPQVKKSFRNISAADAWMLKHSEGVRGLSGEDLKAASAAERRGDSYLRVKRYVTGELEAPRMEDVELMAETIAPRGGVYQPENVNSFAKMWLSASGADMETVGGITARSEEGFISLRHKGEELFRFASDANERFAIGEMTKRLKTLLPEGAVGREITKELYRGVLGQREIYSPEWVRMMYENAYGANRFIMRGGNLVIEGPRGPIGEFGSWEDAGIEIFRSSMNEDTLRAYLQQEKGLSLRTTPSGQLAVTRNYSGREYVPTGFKPGADARDLIGKNPGLVDSIPLKMGPDRVVIWNDAPSMKYQLVEGEDGKNYWQLTGTIQQVNREMSKFFEISPRNSKVFDLASPEGVIRRLGKEGSGSLTEVFEVDVPKIGHVERFDNWKDAQDFLKDFAKDSYPKWWNLEGAAASKGFRITHADGMWYLWNRGTKRTSTAETLEQLYEVFRRNRIPKVAPNLLEETATEVTEGLNTSPFEPLANPVPVELKFENLVPKEVRQRALGVTRIGRSMDGWLSDMVRVGGAPEELLTNWRTFEKLRATGDAQVVHGWKLVENIFIRDGKSIPKAKLIAMRELFEMPQEQWATLAAKKGLGVPELESMKMAREWMESLGERYGVLPEFVINDYLPRVRKFLVNGNNKVPPNGSIKELIRLTAPEGYQKQITAFFENLRTEDLVAFADKVDLKQVLLAYVDYGERTLWMKGAWENLRTTFETSIRNQTISPEGIKWTMSYMSEVMGHNMQHGMVMWNNFTEEFVDQLTKLTGVPFKVMGDPKKIFRGLMAYNYLNNMGFRMWTGFRNMHQIFTMLGSRVGIEPVVESMNNVNKGKSYGKLLNEMRNSGEIQPQLPLGGGEVVSKEGPLAWLLGKALGMFKSTDEYTRGVVHQFVYDNWDEAVEQYAKGTIKAEDFAKVSFLDQMDAPLQRQVYGLISEGKWKAARDTYSQQLIYDTMFNYKVGAGPGGKQNWFGRTFWQYGTYSVFYRDAVKKLWVNGPKGVINKAARMTRFAAIGVGMHAAYKKIFGVNANNFLPWNPALFTGGPYAQLVVKVIQSLGRGYQARQSRSELLGIRTRGGKPYWNWDTFRQSEAFRQFAPGGTVARYFRKGIEKMAKGNYYEGLLDMLTMPYRPEDVDESIVGGALR